MTRHKRFCCWLLIAGAASVLSACGGGDQSASVPGGDQTAFVPEGIRYDLHPQGRDGLKLIAASVVDVPNGWLWLIALKNEGTQFVCEPQVPALFLDENMFELGRTVAEVEGTMHLTDNQSVESCLAPGDTGVGFGMSRRPDVDIPIKSVTYLPEGFLYDAATKLADVALDKIAIADASAATTTVNGTLANRGSTTPHWPQTYVFPLNSVGRPFAFGTAMGPDSLAPGGHWDFNISVNGPVGRYAAFARYR